MRARAFRAQRAHRSARNAQTDIPRWPRTSVVLHDDGTGVLTINGSDEPVAAADVHAARALVLERVVAYARDELARAVRLLATDPDGSRSELAVHPDGHVVELSVEQQAASPRRVAQTAVPRRRRRRAVRGRPLGLALAVGVAIAAGAIGVLQAQDDGGSAVRAGMRAAAPSESRLGAREAAAARMRRAAGDHAAVQRASRAAARRLRARSRAAARVARARSAAKARRARARARARVALRRAAVTRARRSPALTAVDAADTAARRPPPPPAPPPVPRPRTREPQATPGDLPPAVGGP